MSSAITFYHSKLATAKIRATLLAVLIFLLPFERIPSYNVGGLTIRLSQLVALAFIFVSLKPIINYYQKLPRLPKWLLPAFLASYFISTLMAATDIKRAAMIWLFTVFVALVASAIAATLDAKQLPRLEKYLYAATVIVLVVGFYQYFGDVFGLPASWTGLRGIYTKEVFGFPRIQSTGLEPLYYGSFLLIPYCLLLSRRLLTKAVSKWQTILLIAISCQIVLTVSRGALYSAIIVLLGLGVTLLIMHRTSIRKWLKAAVWITLGALIAVSLTWGASQFTNNKEGKYAGNAKTQKLVDQASNLESQGDRSRNRVLAYDAFKEHPIFGIGPGNFSDYAVTKYPAYAKAAPVIVNNEPLELLAEAGIIGFVIFVLFVGWSYISVAGRFTILDITKQTELAVWAAAILAYLAALAVQYQTFSTLYIMHVWVVLGLLMAFGAQAKTKPKN